jgi:hypothetical protein
MAYTESLFTACAAWALWCVLRERWVAAGLLAAAAGLTRPSGVAVVAAVWAGVALGRGRARWFGAALAPLGWIGYVLWVGAETGRGPAGYLRVQGDWGNGFDFGAAYGRFVWHQLTTSPAAGIGLLAFVGLVLWAYAACLRQRQPVPLLVYTGVIVALALGAQAYFNSKPRLLLPGFPLFLPLSAWLATLRLRWTLTALITLTAASAVYGALWLLGPGPP